MHHRRIRLQALEVLHEAVLRTLRGDFVCTYILNPRPNALGYPEGLPPGCSIEWEPMVCNEGLRI